jgi:hypothetical protein
MRGRLKAGGMGEDMEVKGEISGYRLQATGYRLQARAGG